MASGYTTLVPSCRCVACAGDGFTELEMAPGHLFEWTDRGELIRFLTMVMEYGWDAEVLPAVQDRPSKRWVVVSHDEWAEVREVPPQELR